MQGEWFLKRNCSLTPGQVGKAYALICLGALGIALAIFMLHGIWFVFAFTLLELGGIALALLHYARHALDHEHIALSDGCLLVERIQAGRREQVRLDPNWTRVALPGPRSGCLIRLEARGVQVEVGAFVSEARRQQVAVELKRALCMA
jgi:uncharacterized membrane protein